MVLRGRVRHPARRQTSAQWGSSRSSGRGAEAAHYAPRPTVDIARFVEAIGKLAWRHGVVAGPGVKHEVQANGDHVITIVVPKLIATWADPVKGSPPANYPSAGWTPRKD